MIAPDDCQSYLQEICRRYEQWWTEAPLTEVIAARQTTFSFEQMVQTEEKDSQGNLKKSPPLPIFTAIQNYIESEHILLIGSPGGGKSTTLLQCLFNFAEAELGKPKPRIPVLVQLKQYTRVPLEEGRLGILTLIKNALKRQLSKLRPRPKIEISHVEELLDDERLILLLDGLNEMPAINYRTHLIAFCEEYDQLPLICTTRELWGGDLRIKRKLQIQPLMSQEIDRFLQECIPDQKQKVSQLLNRDNRDLSRTPFVLWMLYDLFKRQDTELETIAEAFRKFFSSFQKYKEDVPVSEERRKDWNCWLEHLAFTMLDNLDPTDPGLVFSKEQAEKVLDKKFGDRYGTSSRIEELLDHHLIEQISEKEISFHHQLIQEYYAAECLLTQLTDLLKTQPDKEYTPFETNYLNYLKWTEVFAMMLPLVEDKGEVVSVVQLALNVDLMLGAKLAGQVREYFQYCVVHLINSQPICKGLKINLLSEMRSITAAWELSGLLEEVSVSERNDVIEALEKIGGDAVSLAASKAFKYPELRGKAFLLLGKLGLEQAFQILNDAVEHPDDDIRWGAAIALAKINSEAAIQILLRAIENSNFDVKMSAAFALGTIGHEIAIPILKRVIYLTELSDTRKMMVYALARIDSEEAISLFRQLMQDSNLSKLAIKVLLNMNPEEIAPRLHKIIYTTRHQYENIITTFLNSEDIVNSLLRAIKKDTRPNVVSNASLLLKKADSPHPQILASLWKHQIELYQVNTAELITAIQSRCGFYNYEIYQYTQDVNKLESSDDFIGQLYKDIDQVIYQIERNPELRQQDGEDRLTIEIVGSLRSSGYSANHDCKIGGHVDLTVEQNDLIWLGEAKIYKDNNYLWEGFPQLTTRYSTGDTNQNSGGLLIYIFDENTKSIMEKWQDYLSNKGLPDYSDRPCKMRDLAFISSHRHERSGHIFHVRHMPVLLHFAPKDKSGRRRKNKL